MYRSISIQQYPRLFSHPITTSRALRQISSLPINKLNSPRSFPTKTPASLTYFQNQRREYGLFDNFKRIFKQELDKNKDLKDSIEDLKKQKDAIVDSEIAKSVKKPVDQTKEILQKVKTSVSEYNVGEKALKGFENISDKINTASDFLKETSSKVPGFGKTETQKKGQKTAADDAVNAEQPQTDAAENTQKTVEDSPQSEAKTTVAEEPHPTEPISEYAKQDTREEEPAQQVVDIVPMAVPKKGWFNFSPKLSKTVDQIRLYIPNFSIVEFLQKANEVHRDFLIALNTKNSELLTEVTTDLLAERLTALWVKGEEEVDQCHVIENFDAELEDCDPEKPSIRLGFEAHLVLIRPDGTVLPITLPRGDTSSVVQVKGAFEWTFDEGDALINDFMCYHMDTIY